MGHYEERLEKDLNNLRNHIAEVGDQVDKAIKNAAESVIKLDRRLASDTILGDFPINRAVEEVERLSHAFIARHSPSAGNLRFASSVLRLMVVLERIGDYAVSISRETIQLSPNAVTPLVSDIELMVGQSREVLSKAMEAFLTSNPELARGTMGMADTTRSVFRTVFKNLVEEGNRGAHTTEDLFALLTVLYRLERISDQAKNICERTVFAATGETKQPKVFHILFVDKKNDCGSLMAEAIAARTFPDSGQYGSAGWRAAEKVNPRVLEFMSNAGYNLEDRKPRQLDTSPEALVNMMIVGVERNIFKRIPELPFRTVLIEWPIKCGVGEGGDHSSESLQKGYNDLVARICELMETIRGDVTS